MRYLIYHPQPGSTKPKKVEVKGTTLAAAKAEYQRLQELYPSREMCLIAENEYGRSRIHQGRWD